MTSVKKRVITMIKLMAEAVVSVPIVAIRLAAVAVAGILSTATVLTMFTGMALLQCVAFAFSGEITSFWKDTAEVIGKGIAELGRLVLCAVKPPFR